MAMEGDLISFDIIETQKENIQSLPSGRSAKSLATVFSPLAIKSPLSHTQDLNNAMRAEYEKELSTIDESDDPLDIYDRYVRWTLDAYPSAQATPASQLLPLLERATKAFLSSTHYKNDPRYLKIWLHYIRFFSDSPRETFVYLSRHSIGEALALYYEEFAAWLENAGRWNQAEEVYKTGIEKQARPVERLARKFGEFEQRAAARPQGEEGPSSPALPTVRPALAAKHDPFSVGSPPAVDPQAASRISPPACSSRRQKLQIFSDEGDEERPSSNGSAKGWETIGTLAERKKENTIEPTAWTGEKLNMGSKQNAGVSKMTIFKDESSRVAAVQGQAPGVHDQTAVNPKTGRIERVFVNLEAIYPNPDDPSEEFSFEELRAAKRGWLQRDWRAQKPPTVKKPLERIRSRPSPGQADTTTTLIPLAGADYHESPLQPNEQLVPLNDENADPATAPKSKSDSMRRMQREAKDNRTRKIKVREIRNETQTIQTNLDSPQRPKLKKRKSAEPTMTVHTKAATDEVYELFNAPLEPTEEIEEESQSASDLDDDGYASAGESTGTGRISTTTSEIGEETQGDVTETRSITGESAPESQCEEETGDATAEPTSEDTGWSEFTKSKHVPKHDESNATSASIETGEDRREDQADATKRSDDNNEEVSTPVSPNPPEVVTLTRYIPMPPEDFEMPTRPYRDPAVVANNRLPFMTPIVEKTESSLGALTIREDKDYFNAKTPCPKADQKTPTIPEMGDVWSSPFQEQTEDVEDFKAPEVIPQPVLGKAKSQETAPVAVVSKSVSSFSREKAASGPLIKDTRCNPMDDHIRNTILSEMQPPLSSFQGYFEHRESCCGKKTDIQKYCKSISNAKRNGNDKTASMSIPMVLSFAGTDRKYAVRRELGVGAFAPVYLVENVDDQTGEAQDQDAPAVMGKGKFGISRRSLEAIKCEEPPSAWEFYIIRTAHRRLGLSRAAESIVRAYEMHLFKDEGYLVEEYRDQGTLLDLVNIASNESVANGGAHTGFDEALAMFFTVELLRTVEALHAKGLIHGDLKADNVLVRFDAPPTASADGSELPVSYRRDGAHGWSSKGVSLIDFGRGIDTRVFAPHAQFIADWPTSASDCAEMRELRPWTFQADYHGIAAIVHTMLFAKYIDTVADKGGPLGAGAAKTYRLKESLKRWWQGEIWIDFFALMLNSARHVEAEEGARLPVLRGMKALRERMEAWLEENSDKGVGLRSSIRRMEALIASRKRS